MRPHDGTAFTQGLVMHEDTLFESTGLYGQSTLRAVVPETGGILRSIRLPNEYFGEGLARVGKRLIQLTWRRRTALVYDLDTFETIGRFSYRGEGWGLCFDGESLYMSNGSSIITRRDPITFEVLSRERIALTGRPVRWLNELECVGRYLYANVWRTNSIVQIDKRTGAVVAIVDASSLLRSDDPHTPGQDVMNGIAYNPKSETFLLTGKRWPRLFEVRFVRAKDADRAARSPSK